MKKGKKGGINSRSKCVTTLQSEQYREMIKVRGWGWRLIF